MTFHERVTAVMAVAERIGIKPGSWDRWTPAVNFDLWRDAADLICLKRHGFGIDDLADYCYRDAFDDGMTPAQAVSLAVAAEFA